MEPSPQEIGDAVGQAGVAALQWLTPRDRQRLAELLQTCARLGALRDEITAAERRLVREMTDLLAMAARDRIPTPESTAIVATLEHGLRLLPPEAQ